MLESCFWDLESDDFARYMSDLFVDLQRNDIKVIELCKKKKKIKNESKEVEDILDGFSDLSLSKENVAKLIEVRELDREIQTEYEKTVFLAGCRESYKYLRSIGLIE